MKQYNIYKPSGIEWLRDIPEHWDVKRVKDLGFLQNGISKGGEYFGFGFPFVSYSDVYKGQIKSDLIKGLANSTLEDQKLYSVKAGDVFFTRTSETIDEIGIASTALENIKHATLSGFVIRFRPQRSINKHFSNYFFKAHINRIFLSNEINLVTRASLSQSTLNNLPVLIPQCAEQTAIANYLDTKTAAIDRKIELLTAKANKYKALRRSLINETVCRGLNPNAALKDSGIEWIGMIPEHWEVKRVKEIFYIGRGRVIGQDELVDDGRYPVFSSQTENNGCLGYINTFDFNTTLLTWTTDGANAGTLFKREGKFNCTNVCGTLKPKKRKENLDFILYVLQIAAKHNKRIDTNGAKIMNNEMSVIPLLYPPKEEQEAIAQYLNEKTTQIDTILTNINEQITKLTQLRKTLINDVVTGKIKVTED